MYSEKDIYPKIEAMLFASGEPVKIEKMAEVLEMEKEKFEKALESYSLSLENGDRGVKTVRMNDCVQLVTKSRYHKYVAGIFDSKGPKSLSQSALEVLSVIAYNQPVTKTVIDSIRGVDSYNSLCRLMERELIEQRGTLNTIGHPKLYGTTDEFLRMFGLRSIHELPPVSQNVSQTVVKEDNNMTFDDIENFDYE